MLIHLLAKWPNPTTKDRDEVKKYLQCPACWPSNGEVSLPTEFQESKCPVARSGEVLLIGAQGNTGNLWWLHRTTADQKFDNKSLGPKATEAQKEVCALVRQMDRLRKQEGRITDWETNFLPGFICKADQRLATPDLLEGESAGLSFFISVVSYCLDTRVPIDIAASAKIGKDGELIPVDGITAKAEILASAALGVTRFLVARDDKHLNDKQARRVFDDRRSTVNVSAFEHVEEVLDLVFPKKWRDHLQPLRAPRRSISVLPELRPDVDLQAQTSSTPLLAEWIDKSQDALSSTFDLGMTWGLGRGRLLGLVAGFCGSPLLQTLVRVEGTLFDAIRAAGLTLPVRWWFHCRCDQYKRPPENDVELRNMLAELQSGQLANRHASHGLPFNTIPGFVLEFPVPTEADSAMAAATASAWTQQLFAITAMHASAVIIHMEAPIAPPAIAAIKQLQMLLSAAKDLPPIEVGRLWHAPSAHDVEAIASNELWPDEAQAQTLVATEAPGTHFCRWIAHAMRRLPKQHTTHAVLSAIVREHKKIGALFKYFTAKLPAQDGSALPGSAVTLLSDLECMSPESDGVDAELLSFVEILLPDRIIALLRAYAQNLRRDPDALRAVLQFSARSRCYVDEFVKASLCAQRFPGPSDLFASGGSGGAYGLPILEGLSRQRDDFQLKELADRFLAPFDEYIGMLGIETTSAMSAAEAVRNSSSPEPSHYRILLQGSVSRQLVTLLLAAPPLSRAPVGLVSIAEWKQITNDQYLHEQVIACRGGRKLDMGSSHRE